MFAPIKSENEEIFVGHYIELVSNPTEELLNKLKENYSKFYRSPTDMASILLSDCRGWTLDDDDRYVGFAVEITTDRIERTRKTFLSDKKELLDFLDAENVEYDVNFGCVKHYGLKD